MSPRAQSTVPRLDTPLVNPDGTPSIPWYYFFVQLWKNSGGSTPGALVSYLATAPGGGFEVYNASTNQLIGVVTNSLAIGEPVVPQVLGLSPFVFSAGAPGFLVVFGAKVELSRDSGAHWFQASLVGGSFPLRNGDSARVSWTTGTPEVEWWQDAA